MRAPLLLLLVAAPAEAALPPITSLAQARGQLAVAGEAEQRAALANLSSACQGKFRRELRDQPDLLARVEALFAQGALELRRAALDTVRCFSPARFAPLLERAIQHEDPAVAAYGAEVAARTEHAPLLGAVLAALGGRAAACAQPGLEAREQERCVWLTYAPGALLARGSPEDQARVATALPPLFTSPYRKVREVAVESAAATGRVELAAELGRLIAREEQKGGFAEPNEPALVARFKERRRALEKKR